jgi:hypothetical protein
MVTSTNQWTSSWVRVRSRRLGRLGDDAAAGVVDRQGVEAAAGELVEALHVVGNEDREHLGVAQLDAEDRGELLHLLADHVQQ